MADSRRVEAVADTSFLIILGHLLLLKQLGHINPVRDYLERLTERGFFLSERIVAEVLLLAGER